MLVCFTKHFTTLFKLANRSHEGKHQMKQHTAMAATGPSLGICPPPQEVLLAPDNTRGKGLVFGLWSRQWAGLVRLVATEWRTAFLLSQARRPFCCAGGISALPGVSSSLLVLQGGFASKPGFTAEFKKASFLWLIPGCYLK